MSYPGRPCGGSFTPKYTSVAVPSRAGQPAEEDVDTLIERYAREFEQMEKQGDLSSATWEHTVEELAKSAAMLGGVNLQYDPEAKNRTVKIPPEDRFRLLAFIEAQRKKAQQQSGSQGGQGQSTTLKKRKRK